MARLVRAMMVNRVRSIEVNAGRYPIECGRLPATCMIRNRIEPVESTTG
jgi:hypothetical protein